MTQSFRQNAFCWKEAGASCRPTGTTESIADPAPPAWINSRVQSIVPDLDFAMELAVNCGVFPVKIWAQVRVAVLMLLLGWLDTMVGFDPVHLQLKTFRIVRHHTPYRNQLIMFTIEPRASSEHNVRTGYEPRARIQFLFHPMRFCFQHRDTSFPVTSSEGSN